MQEARKIQDIDLQEKMKEAYLDYSMSVIVGRAIPDVRDGLKPVHRRILYAMWDMGLKHTQAYKKSARVVGDVLGKYHPHGDRAVYDAMVRMAQDFSLRYPLVDGQGNFGSIDGDSPAAMRYCVTGDTLIPTDQGSLPIGKISDGLESEIDIKVTNYQGNSVDAEKYFDSGRHETIKINTEQDYELEGSKNHPILCWTKENDSKPSLEWKIAENIEEGDIAVINRKNKFSGISDLDLSRHHPENSDYKDIKLPKKMNKDLAFLLGSFVAEASFQQDKIVFNNQDLGFNNKLREIIFEQFKGTELYEREIQGDSEQFSICHQEIVDFFKNIGFNKSNSNDREVPFTILLSDQEILKQFLKGLFEVDGSISSYVDEEHGEEYIDIELVHNSSNKKLLKQLKTLLLNFGIVTTDYHRDDREGCFKLLLSGYKNVKRFYDNIGFYSQEKQSKLEEIEDKENNGLNETDYIPFLSDYLREKYGHYYLKKHNPDRYSRLREHKEKILDIVEKKDQKLIKKLLDREYFFSKITDVKQTNEEKRVYSIRVNSDCHSFMANGFINHNTEARLTEISEEMLEDMDKETVEFRDNFDGSLEEPKVLPSKVPNLLINGASGIAVGMATNIPPHNLTEVIDAIIDYINLDNPSIEDLMSYVKGPDFPTGGKIVGKKGIRRAYENGKGKVTIRANIDVLREEKRLVVDEIPYNVRKSKIVEQIADLVKEKEIEGISDLRDESDREGLRIVVDLKRNTNPDVVLNKLFKKTKLEKTFGVTNLAIVDGEPEVLNLKQIISQFVEHRVEVVRNRTQYLLNKAENRLHILNGLLIALEDIENVVDLIQESEDREEANKQLIDKYDLSEDQSNAILRMRLQKLTGLEKNKLEDEHKSVSKEIEEYKTILANRENILEVVKDELKEIREEYGDERRTEIERKKEQIDEIDLIPEEKTIISITKEGYVKRTELSEFRKQKRGGKGLISMNTKKEDEVRESFVASTHDYLLFFTDKGNIYWLRTFKIPEYGRRSQGRPIVNILTKIDKDEEIKAILPIDDLANQSDILFATKKGKIKRTSLEEFNNPRPSGIIAINIEKDDELVEVTELEDDQDIILLQSSGKAIRFDESELSKTGRDTRGVKGIGLDKNEELVSMTPAKESQEILPITKKGYGKRTEVKEITKTHRAGKGIRAIKIDEKNGEPTDLITTKGNNELFITTKKGISLRTETKNISKQSRNARGVKIIDLKENDIVKSLKTL